MLKKLHFLIVSFSIFCFLTPLKSAIADIAPKVYIASKAYVDDGLAAKVNTADLAGKIADAVTGKEDIANKVDNFDGELVDNTKYPSALAVKNALVLKVNTADLATEIASAITGKEDVSNKVSDLSASFTDNTQYPSALAVKNALANKVDITAGTNQTLSGTYTVAGTLSVNTPTLPAS